MEHWPQYTYLALVFLNLGLSIGDHGKPRKPENAVITVIALALSMSLLAVGGFFKGM